MNASKENAAKALEIMNTRCFEDTATGPEEDVAREADAAFVRVFLTVAMRKLPKEESFAKEKTRSKAPKK